MINRSSLANVNAAGVRAGFARTALGLLLGLLVLGTAAEARAQSIIKEPNNHKHYAVEIEPHGLIGLFGPYNYATGIGAGLRVSIPIVQNGFIPKLNNSIAISFGTDWVHYTGCYYGSTVGCGIESLFFPVAMQWNFFLTRDWSVFGEPGLAIFHYFYHDDWCNGYACNVHGDTGVTPVFDVGARWHFSDSAALTMRIGYPSFSVGVSFM